MKHKKEMLKLEKKNYRPKKKWREEINIAITNENEEKYRLSIKKPD